MRRWLWIALALAGAVLGGGAVRAWVAHVERPSFTPITLAPEEGARMPQRVFGISHDVAVVDIVPEPGTGTLHVLLQEGTLNLWPIVLSRWPEIGLVLCAVPALLALRWLLRPPRSSGPLFCRRCRYPLAPGIGALCPECGLELTPRNRVPQRPARWKLLVPLLVFALLASGYVLFRSALPRRGFASEWFIWPSRVLYAQAAKRGWHSLCNSNRAFRYRLIEFDPASGRAGRTILCRSGQQREWNGMVASGDGRTLAVIAGPQIFLVDAASGSVRRRIDWPYPNPSPGQSFFYQAALSHDGAILYAMGWQRMLSRWDARTGGLLDDLELEALVDLEALAGAVVRCLEPLEGGGVAVAIDCYLLDGNEAMVLLLDRDLRATATESRVRTRAVPWMAIDAGAGTWQGLSERNLLIGRLEPPGDVWQVELPGDYSTALASWPQARLLAVGHIQYDPDVRFAGLILDSASLAPLATLGPGTLGPHGYAFLPQSKSLACWGRHRVRGSVLAVYDLSDIWPRP